MAVSPMVCPWLLRASLGLLIALVVHCTRLCGSPFGSSSASKSVDRVLSFTVPCLLPPPFLRRLPPGSESSPASNSCRPLPIVLLHTPPSRPTRFIPPAPLRLPSVAS